MARVANVIYRGPVEREPETINFPVAGAYLPGIVVGKVADELVAADDATSRLLILSNRRFMGQDIDTAYVAGDTGVAYRAESDQEYQARFSAGTYAQGDELTVDADSRFAAASAGSVVVAFYDGQGATLEAGDLDDIVIATNSYVQGA